MKINFKKYLLICRNSVIAIAFLLNFQSCQKKDDIAVKSNTLVNNNIITADYATEIAENINKSELALKSRTTKSAASRKQKKIKNSRTIQEGKNPYFFIFNYQEGGFTVISGDRRLMPIMAYSEYGQFGDTIPSGLANWMLTTTDIIKDIRVKNAAPSPSVLQEWQAMECPPPLATKSVQVIGDCPPSGGSTDPVTTSVGPLVPCTWGQKDSFNTYCFTITGLQARTGCIPTAMAQVMMYWRFPTYYNWANMPLTWGNSDVAHLMNAAGVSVAIKYGTEESGANHQDIDDALKNTFNYSSASDVAYDYLVVKQQLSLRQPVILSGYSVKETSWLGLHVTYSSGHEWVCDGYSSTQYPTFSTLYFHMNWGWHNIYGGDDCNGWYAYNNWATSNGFNFQYAQRAIVNIHP